jgi:hypothetical protein
MSIRSFVTPGAFEPAAIAAMSEAFDAACKELNDTGHLKSCSKSSPSVLLRRLGKASAIQFACGKLRSQDIRASETSRSLQPK